MQSTCTGFPQHFSPFWPNALLHSLLTSRSTSPSPTPPPPPPPSPSSAPAPTRAAARRPRPLTARPRRTRILSSSTRKSLNLGRTPRSPTLRAARTWRSFSEMRFGTLGDQSVSGVRQLIFLQFICTVADLLLSLPPSLRSWCSRQQCSQGPRLQLGPYPGRRRVRSCWRRRPPRRGLWVVKKRLQKLREYEPVAEEGGQIGERA